MTTRLTTVGCAVSLAFALGAAGPAAANTIVPDVRFDEPGLDPDNGNCTLREAIESADHDVSEDDCRRGSGADLIKLGRGTYRLSVPGNEMVGSTEIDNRIGDLDIGLFGSSPLRIVGHRRGTTVDGNDHDRVFQVFGARPVTFERLTITDGQAVNLGGGVNVYDNAEARFVRSSVTDSTGADGGGGVAVFPGGEASFTRGLVRGNGVPPGKAGGGLAVLEGRVRLDRTGVIGNQAGAGGGIALFPDAGANLSRVRLVGNDAVASGGGIQAATGSRLNVSRSTVRGNGAGGEGGGIKTDRAAVVINASTLVANEANQRGGGISATGSPAEPMNMRITNSTISGNRADADGTGGADGEGGGLSIGAAGSKLIVNSTITRNRAHRGGGIQGPFVGGAGPVRLKGTIVAGNTVTSPGPSNGPDCLLLVDGSGMSLGHNLIGAETDCGFGARASDIIGANPRLGRLGRNGGPTETHALRRGSRAINNGPNDAPRRDQRGVRRRNPDIGAFERR